MVGGEGMKGRRPGGAVTTHPLSGRLWASVHPVPPLVLGISGHEEFTAHEKMEKLTIWNNQADACIQKTRVQRR